MKSKIHWALIAALVGLAAPACLGSDFSDSVEGSWELRSGMLDGETLSLVDSHPVTMTLENDEIGGTAACNSYGGQYSISGADFSLEGGVSVTEMACMPAEVMESERQFLDALQAANQVELTSDGLVLRGPRAELSFDRLEPVPTSELIGTIWILDGLVQGDTVSSPMAGAEPATLELFEDGTFVGSTGCRDISGNYQITGAEVQFTSWGAEGECRAELHEQDNRVISGLEGGFRVEIDGNRMMTWVPGDEGLIYRAEA